MIAFDDFFDPKGSNIRCAFVGSYALYLHCLSEKIPFYRNPKDVDLYSFEYIINDQIPFYDTRKINKMTFYGCRNPVTNGKMALDLFSDGFLVSFSSPSFEDIEESNMLPGIFLSSIEHLLISKLCSTLLTREKDIEDLKFIVSNFSVDQDKFCSMLYKTRHNEIPFSVKRLSKGDIETVLSDVYTFIIKKYSSASLDLYELHPSLLVTLLNYEEVSGSKLPDHLYRKNCDVKIHHATLKLGYYFLSHSYPYEDVLENIFPEVIAASMRYKLDIDARFLTRCRYVNSLLRQDFEIEEILNLIRSSRFIPEFFRLINSKIKQDIISTFQDDTIVHH
jgi:hypothetical protein